MAHIYKWEVEVTPQSVENGCYEISLNGKVLDSKYDIYFTILLKHFIKILFIIYYFIKIFKISKYEDRDSEILNYYWTSKKTKKEKM